MQTEQEIEKIAEEMAIQMIAAEKARQIAEEHARIEKYGICPHCKCGYKRDICNVQDAQQCTQCFAYFKGEFTHYFPVWAQDRKANFRRAFCLMFGIKGDPNDKTNLVQNGRKPRTRRTKKQQTVFA